MDKLLQMMAALLQLGPRNVNRLVVMKVVDQFFPPSDSFDIAANAEWVWVDGVRYNKDAPRKLCNEARLQAFKAYVHKRLDDAGVPTEPDVPHSKASCRVGDRLDYVFNKLANTRNALKRERARHSALHKVLGDAGFTMTSKPRADGKWGCEWKVEWPAAIMRADKHQALLKLLDAKGIGYDWHPVAGWRVTDSKRRVAAWASLIEQLQGVGVTLSMGEAGGYKVDRVYTPPIPPLAVELQEKLTAAGAGYDALVKECGRMQRALDRAGVRLLGKGGDYKVELPIAFVPYEQGIEVRIKPTMDDFMCNRDRSFAVEAGQPGYDLIYRLHQATLTEPAKA